MLPVQLPELREQAGGRLRRSGGHRRKDKPVLVPGLPEGAVCSMECPKETGCVGLLTGCDQGVARSLGGDMTLELEPGQKLEMITWKDDSLWYLTRPIQDGEEPETHTFQQSSEFGVFEGTVTIVESAEE